MEDFKSAEDLIAELQSFGVRSYAMLVDDSRPQMILNPQPGLECRGVYTFTLDAADQTIAGHTVKLLPFEQPPPACDAWIVCTGSKAIYPLLQYLHKTGGEASIVFPLAKRGFASMYSYVDFLKGETNTVVYLQNVFERTYKIHFPIAVRWLLRTLNGKIVKASQRIIPPNAMTVFDAREMDLPDGFSGYLELFTEVRNLNGEVVPFLHMNCDYLGEDGIASIHQSGLKPWAPRTPFVRGIVPAAPDTQLTVSLFNKVNREPIVCRAGLRYTLDGQRQLAVRELPPIPHQHMVYVNINELFAPELTQGATQADVVVVADREMHRPNNYLHPKGKPRSWTAVEHGASIVGAPISDKRRQDLNRFGIYPWTCPFPILDERSGVETSLIFFEEGPCQLHDFLFIAHDEAGRKVLEKEERIGFGAVINLRDWLRASGVELKRGLVNVMPGPRADPVPDTFSFLGSFCHRRRPNLSPQVIGGDRWNVPIEIDRSTLWNHPMVPTVHSEEFGKLIVSEEYDTIIPLFNFSSQKVFITAAEVNIDVYTWDGRMRSTSKAIPPNSSITLIGSELLEELGLRSEKPYYSIWVYCRDLYVYGFHLLYRKRDNALAVGHFYHGRFNSQTP